ncbi:MAG TPA: CoA transferase [Anaerolineae bacterium]|nr:CoA transferase [Anaerolineae bacterium]
MKRPLAGLTVLDFTRVFSGPYATLLLADLGARVIKVEPVGSGDDSRAFGPFVAGTSGYFETLNRGKQSLALDLRQPEGQQLARDLAARADVLIENFRPGRMARLGLDAARLRAESPGLVYVSISGFGQTGPLAARGCYDIVAQAYGGLMAGTGPADEPTKAGPPVADALSGLTAAVGMLAALWRRERTGEGAHVDVAMVDALFAVLETSLATYDLTGSVPPRRGNADAVLAPFDSFRASDGWIVIGVGNDALWQALAALISPALAADARFASNADRLRNEAHLRPILAAWCGSHASAALLDRLHAAGVPAGPIRAIDELACDPNLEARGMLARVALHGGGHLAVPGSPIHVDGRTPPIVRGPRLGEHSRTVLTDLLGANDALVERLLAAAVIGEA